MGKLMVFALLWRLTGNPLVAGLILIVAALATDRFALGLLPHSFYARFRFGEIARLRDVVRVNPHDRPARRALAELLVARGQHRQAAQIVTPALATDRPEPGTLLVAAEAFLGAGEPARARSALEAAESVAHSHQAYDVALLAGRVLEAQGRPVEAVEAYREAVACLPGRVEPRFRLSRALKAAGDPATAEETRRGAWTAYTQAPGFQRRQERRWAWRANPARPMLYAAVLFGLGVASAVTFGAG